MIKLKMIIKKCNSNHSFHRYQYIKKINNLSFKSTHSFFAEFYSDLKDLIG